MSVSVFIPTRNMSGTLAKAIESAASQSPLEVLVIDDASTDDTPSVIAAAQERYPMVRHVRHETKSHDWQEAAMKACDSLQCTHVIGLSADDSLMPGVIASVESFGDVAAVFHSYFVSNVAGEITGAVTVGVESAVALSSRQVRDKIRSNPHAVETGIGSAIAMRHLRWLNELRWWEMGPWADAIGYATVAALHGAGYSPALGATFCVDDSSYGAVERSGERVAAYGSAARRFLAQATVPPCCR